METESINTIGTVAVTVFMSLWGWVLDLFKEKDEIKFMRISCFKVRVKCYGYIFDEKQKFIF